MWFLLKNESSRDICHNFLNVFSILGSLNSILTDNAPNFKSKEIVELCQNWGIKLESSCAYRPQGNGIIERVHRQIKRAVGRTRRSVQECVFWYNNSINKDNFEPYHMASGLKSKKPGVCHSRVNMERPVKVSSMTGSGSKHSALDKNPIIVDDKVFLRDPRGRCNIPWSGPHRVTRILSNVSVELNEDNVSRHISHLRLAPKHKNNDCLEIEAELEIAEKPRRPARNRKPPAWHKDYIFT